MQVKSSDGRVLYKGTLGVSIEKPFPISSILYQATLGFSERAQLYMVPRDLSLSMPI